MTLPAKCTIAHIVARCICQFLCLVMRYEGQRPCGFMWNPTRMIVRPSSCVAFLLSLGFLAHVGLARSVDRQSMRLETLSPSAASDQLISRVLSPLTQRDVKTRLTYLKKSVRQHHIKPGEESLDLYLPAVSKDVAVGLLVFIPPIDDFQLPREWWPVLEKHRLAVAVLKRAGNGQNTIERRIPLTLHALANVSEYRVIDDDRVYIGGFSGGARTAQIVAMGYPDIFRGALLFAGSDVVGEGIVPPSGDLMQVFQERSRIVLSTGSRDSVNVVRDAKAKRSLAKFCASGVDIVPQQGLGHELPGRAGFDKAVAALLESVKQASGVKDCRVALNREISAKLDRIQAEANGLQTSERLKELAAIDALYGGLASPRSLALGESLLPSIEE